MTTMQKKIWHTVSVIALLMILIGSVIGFYDWDIPCGINQFSRDILLITAAFIGGIVFEMVTGFFHNLECRYEDS